MAEAERAPGAARSPPPGTGRCRRRAPLCPPCPPCPDGARQIPGIPGTWDAVAAMGRAGAGAGRTTQSWSHRCARCHRCLRLHPLRTLDGRSSAHGEVLTAAFRNTLEHPGGSAGGVPGRPARGSGCEAAGVPARPPELQRSWAIAVGGRCPGSLAIAVARTRSTAGGTSGAQSPAPAGSWILWHQRRRQLFLPGTSKGEPCKELPQRCGKRVDVRAGISVALGVDHPGGDHGTDTPILATGHPVQRRVSMGPQPATGDAGSRSNPVRRKHSRGRWPA